VSGQAERALAAAANEVRHLFRKYGQRLVLAESCTGGLIAAALAQLPGVSEQLCGSAVVYREDTKFQWLGVSRALLREHGAVSAPVAEAMARGVLKRTPEADVSASVTGYLGPGHPRDGHAFAAVAFRGERKIWVAPLSLLAESKLRNAPLLRRRRQFLAALSVLFMVRSACEKKFSPWYGDPR
jgi:PncC family amidohydrolase